MPISGGYKGTKSPFNKTFLPCTFSKHVGDLVICFGGCLECSWSKAKERQSTGKGGEPKRTQINLKREVSLTSLPASGKIFDYLTVFPLQLLSHTCSLLFLFVNYPPLDSAPKCPNRRGLDLKWTSLVILAGLQQPSHSLDVKMFQSHSRKLKTSQVLSEAASLGHPMLNSSVSSTSCIPDPPSLPHSSPLAHITVKSANDILINLVYCLVSPTRIDTP